MASSSSSEQLISDVVNGVASVKLINPASKSALPKLDEDNYLFWKFQSLITLRGHGLEGFVAPKVVVPSKHLPSTDSEESSSTPNPAYLQWLRQDNLITAWLVSSMPNSLISEMLDCQTASEVWAILAGRFSSRILARVMELKSKLETAKKGNSSLPEYFAQIKNLVDSLAAAGKKVSLDDHVMHILAGLGPEYDPTVSVLSGDVTTPSLQRVYSMLLTQESRLLRHSSINPDGSLPSVNLTSHSQSTPPPAGLNDGNKRDRQSGQRSNRRWNSNKPQCQLCRKYGHTVVKCFLRFERAYQGPNPNGQGQGNSSFNNTSSQYSTSQSASAYVLQNDLNKENQWYPDSGASNHVTNDLTNLSSSTEYLGDNKVHVGNGTGSSHWQGSSSRQTH